MKRIMITGCIISALVINGCSANMKSVYSSTNKISSNTNSFNLNDESQTMDNQSYVGKLEFEGMDTIWTYNAENNEDVELSYLLSVAKGKAKLVLINSNGDIEIIIENKDNAQPTDMNSAKLSLTEGENRIKLVAQDNAQIELKFKISKGEITKIGFDK
ncbi:hypothetical protein [Faecalimicrobium dakarense]|uniref:hypothetical protein n=1 Tax=Faecalimicrobium dakarense TaxID=1301100 RepID=UPI0004BC59AA|nr:hypothetical protein [[Clostridium] dakarense]